MPEPRRPFLFMTSHSHPLPTTRAASLPQFRIRLTPSHLPWFLKWLPGRRTNPMHKTLIIPKRTSLENQPFPRFADAAPALAFFTVAANPARSIEVRVETEFLLARN